MCLVDVDRIRHRAVRDIVQVVVRDDVIATKDSHPVSIVGRVSGWSQIGRLAHRKYTPDQPGPLLRVRDVVVGSGSAGPVDVYPGHLRPHDRVAVEGDVVADGAFLVNPFMTEIVDVRAGHGVVVRSAGDIHTVPIRRRRILMSQLQVLYVYIVRAIQLDALQNRGLARRTAQGDVATGIARLAVESRDLGISPGVHVDYVTPG